MIDVLKNPIFLILICIFIGQIVGKISVKQIKLGSSAVMFAGIFVSYTLTKVLISRGSIVLPAQYVPPVIFQLSLIGFIVAVGLHASSGMKKILKVHGLKFLLLAFVITVTGALSAFLISKYLLPIHKTAILGTYVGALTSSPGLATVLEAMEGVVELEALVGLGYSISYIPGVAAVVLFVQFIGKKHKSIESKEACLAFKEKGSGKFCLLSFVSVCIVGFILGQIKINLGDFLGYFSLGTTGGVLISSLFFGNMKKLGSFDFDFDRDALFVIRDLSLNMFLAIVGLNFGYNAITLIGTSGAQLLLVGLFTAVISILAGYLFGRKVLKLPVPYLLGGICGGMTSTPGLAASVDTMENDEVTAGYGATYPFALFFMIIGVKILTKL